MKHSSFTLTGTTYTFQEISLEPPFTVALRSSDATRKIEISLDGGTEYFEPLYDFSSVTEKVVAVLSPVTNIKVTGVANDIVTMCQKS